MTNEAIIQSLVLGGLQALTALVVTLVLKKIDAIAKDLKDIGEKVSKHAEKLAAGAAEIEMLKTELSRARASIESIVRDGCARAANCGRPTPIPRGDHD